MKQEHRLTDEQEQQRLEGLRILARIIARHHLAHPELYRGALVEGSETPSPAGERDNSRKPVQKDDVS